VNSQLHPKVIKIRNSLRDSDAPFSSLRNTAVESVEGINGDKDRCGKGKSLEAALIIKILKRAGRDKPVYMGRKLRVNVKE
jgi:hypothetical protein